MGSISGRRLRSAPRDVSDDNRIDRLRARWELFFYCWRWFLLLGVGTAQAVEAIVALVEGRPPHVVLPLPSLK